MSAMENHKIEIPEILPDRQIDRLVGLLEPLERVTRPKVYGIEKVPDDGSLLGGNDTIYAFLDLPFMMAELWKRRHVAVRGLGENAHYAIPVWRDVLTRCGMVRGTRENVRALMRERQTVLVFPGGAREVNKRRREKYQLMWKKRLGFARLAIEHGYPIVPFAAVGAEEMLDILIDENNPLYVYAHLADLIKKLTGWPMQPLVHGMGPTILPHPERLYLWFGELIDTTQANSAVAGDSRERLVHRQVLVSSHDLAVADREHRQGMHVGRHAAPSRRPGEVPDGDDASRPRIDDLLNGHCEIGEHLVPVRNVAAQRVTADDRAVIIRGTLDRTVIDVLRPHVLVHQLEGVLRQGHLLRPRLEQLHLGLAHGGQSTPRVATLSPRERRRIHSALRRA
jgi:1-acyl-sn-glycerol-3-phosphate acyltransferase